MSFPKEFKGYIFKIMGGQDKQGFPMKQGVLTSGRVRVLMERGAICQFSLDANWESNQLNGGKSL